MWLESMLSLDELREDPGQQPTRKQGQVPQMQGTAQGQPPVSLKRPLSSDGFHSTS